MAARSPSANGEGHARARSTELVKLHLDVRVPTVPPSAGIHPLLLGSNVSGGLMVLIGLMIGAAGIWSVRLVILAAGAGAAWLVADEFGASWETTLLVVASGAVLALVVAVFAAKFLFTAVGALVGAVVGAKLFVIIDRGDASALLAAVFVPAVAGCCAVLAARMRKNFIGWATAIAGAAMVLSGLGLIAPRTLGALHRPETSAGQVVSAAVWLAVALGARVVQRRLSPGHAVRRS